MSATIPQDLLLCEQQWAQKIGTQHRAERILLTGESHRCANWQFQAACTLVQATQTPADVLAEPNSLPWREASFDRIISLHSHTSTADLAYWLQQCWQVVAPQGSLLLFGCCPHFMWHKKQPAPDNANVQAALDVQRIAQNIGWNCVAECYFHCLPVLSWRYALFSWAWYEHENRIASPIAAAYGFHLTKQTVQVRPNQEYAEQWDGEMPYAVAKQIAD